MMKVRTTLFGLLFSLALAGGAGAAPLLINGDFETMGPGPFVDISGTNKPNLEALNLDNWGVYDKIPGWETDAGARGIEVQRNTVVNAHSGTNYVELESHPGNSSISAFSQTFTPIVTAQHLLTFYYTPRSDPQGGNLVNATLDGNTVATANGPPPVSGDWVLVSVLLGVLSANVDYTLGFNAFGTNPDNTLGGFIDTVSVSAVPIPAALPLFAGGLGLLGLLGWRRKRNATA